MWSYSSVMDEYNRRTFAVIASQDDTIHIHIIGFCNDGRNPICLKSKLKHDID